MEESVKRKERLKAMRMEASQAGVSNDYGSFTPSHGLANPLIEASVAPSAQVGPYTTPRFDYYTDPMSAFSDDKRRSKVSNQISQQNITPPIGPRNPQVTPPPVHQAQINYSPDQRMYQARGPYHSSGPYRSPVGIVSPYGGHQGTPPGVWNGSGGTSSYHFMPNSSGGGNFHGPGIGQGGSPSFNSGRGRGHWFSNSPAFDSGQGASSAPNPGRGRGGRLGCNMGPGFNSGRGRGHWFNNGPASDSGHGASSSPNSGRGRGGGLGSNMSPGSGWSGGRGLGSQEPVSAELRPDLYYKKSMVEDPWKFLKPVVWWTNSLKTPESSNSWLPKSIRTKKARVYEASEKDSSQPSLAEYLAASLNEAVSSEPVTDEPSV